MSSRRPVDIPIEPRFNDHFFNGKVILPAVEIMEFLASAIQAIRPDISPWVMSNASFSKFLEIPEGAAELSALMEFDDEDEGDICVKLLSQIRFKKITRIKEHAQITFPAHLPEMSKPEAPALSLSTRSTNCITAERIYQELVPFGPAYRTLTGNLHLSDKGAWGTLQAPFLTEERQTRKTLGSPFPLDGAMHAACVFGQCVADFVPFPVGFRQRLIHNPTIPGKQYHTEIIPVSQRENELVFDLSIFDTTGTVYESVNGLRMRDVSGGQITPPDWLKSHRFADDNS